MAKIIPAAVEIEKMGDEILLNSFPRLVIFSDVVNRFVGIALKDRINWLKIEALIQLTVIGKGSLTHSEMARNMLRSKQQITKLANDLEKNGLIKRISDKENRRITRILITNKGLTHIRKSLRDIVIFENIVQGCINEAESKILGDLIRKLRRAFIRELQNITMR
ncbi:MAG: MarR family transcriptional regulator [Deltaproteobacteria bacterium]|nr:MarR family transcriptional regulator [Deltaproteobacteria bacterium]